MAIAQFFGGLAEEFGKTLKMGAILEAKSDQARRQEEQQFKLLEREDELQSKRLFQKQTFDRETKMEVERARGLEETKLLKEKHKLQEIRNKQIFNWLGKRYPGFNIDQSLVNPEDVGELDFQTGGIEQVIDQNPEGGKQAMEKIGYRFIPKITLGEKGGVSVSLQRLQPGEKLTPEGARIAGGLGLSPYTDEWTRGPGGDFDKFNKAMDIEAGKQAARGRAPEAEIERISKKVGAEGLSSLSEGEMRVWVQNKGLNKEVQFAIQDARASVESDINMLTASMQEKDAAVWEKAIRNLNDPDFFRAIQMPFPNEEVRSRGVEQIQKQMKIHGFLETAPKQIPQKEEDPLERLRKRHLK